MRMRLYSPRLTESRTTRSRRSQEKWAIRSNSIWHCATTSRRTNAGLIEVMGLAILPARLKDELEELSKCLVEGKDVRAVAELEKHADWVDEFLPRHPELNSENVMDILKEEVGKVFVGVLEDAGVYKCTEEGRSAFAKFMETL